MCYSVMICIIIRLLKYCYYINLYFCINFFFSYNLLHIICFKFSCKTFLVNFYFLLLRCEYLLALFTSYKEDQLLKIVFIQNIHCVIKHHQTDERINLKACIIMQLIAGHKDFIGQKDVFGEMVGTIKDAILAYVLLVLLLKLLLVLVNMSSRILLCVVGKTKTKCLTFEMFE